MKQEHKNLIINLTVTVIGIILWIAFLLWLFRGV